MIVQAICVALVEIGHHRILQRRVKTFRLDKNTLHFLSVSACPAVRLGGAPAEVFLLWVDIADGREAL
jgi:hypothetical protein